MEGWATGITKIYTVPDLGNTPARVNRRTGEMYLSLRHMLPLPPDIRLFIMLHEMGHVVLQTEDEERVDAWAFDQYVKQGKSLKASVKALTQILDGNNPEHYDRMYLQLQRAKMYDYLKNGNQKMKPNV